MTVIRVRVAFESFMTTEYDFHTLARTTTYQNTSPIYRVEIGICLKSLHSNSLRLRVQIITISENDVAWWKHVLLSNMGIGWKYKKIRGQRSL